MEGLIKQKINTRSNNILPVIVIPNLNGGSEIIAAIRSLQRQTIPSHIIVVDNASTDQSVQTIVDTFPDVEIIRHAANLGYAGGVNPGFRRAIEMKAAYVAPFNDDAIADDHWLERLVNFMDVHSNVAAVAPKLLHAGGSHIDSAGECYTSWGLAYPRGRGESDKQQYDNAAEIFAATGAASLYRVVALQQAGLLDEDFFAYYEDVDLSFRLRLLGWKIWYEPSALVFHETGMTSSRIKGFTTYQTLKNLPLLAYKNIPGSYLSATLRRLRIALLLFMISALVKGNGLAAIRGTIAAQRLLRSKTEARRHIQSTRTVPDEYIWSVMTHDLPPNAGNLRRLRSIYWKMTGRKST